MEVSSLGNNLEINVEETYVGERPLQETTRAKEPDFQALENSLRFPVFIGKEMLGKYTPGEILYNLREKAIAPVIISGLGLLVFEIEALKTASIANVLVPIFGVVFSIGLLGGVHLVASVIKNKADGGINTAMRLYREQWGATKRLYDYTDELCGIKTTLSTRTMQLQGEVEALNRMTGAFTIQVEDQRKMYAKQVITLRGIQESEENIHTVALAMEGVRKSLVEKFSGRLIRMQRQIDRRDKQLSDSRQLLDMRNKALDRLNAIADKLTLAHETEVNEVLHATNCAEEKNVVNDTTEEQLGACAVKIQSMVRGKNARNAVFDKQVSQSLLSTDPEFLARPFVIEKTERSIATSCDSDSEPSAEITDSDGEVKIVD